MNELHTGQLWRSRTNASNMRIITYITPARAYGRKVFFIEYYCSLDGRSMTTVSGLGEWLHHFQLLDAWTAMLLSHICARAAIKDCPREKLNITMACAFAAQKTLHNYTIRLSFALDVVKVGCLLPLEWTYTKLMIQPLEWEVQRIPKVLTDIFWPQS